MCPFAGRYQRQSHTTADSTDPSILSLGKAAYTSYPTEKKNTTLTRSRELKPQPQRNGVHTAPRSQTKPKPKIKTASNSTTASNDNDNESDIDLKRIDSAYTSRQTSDLTSRRRSSSSSRASTRRDPNSRPQAQQPPTRSQIISRHLDDLDPHDLSGGQTPGSSYASDFEIESNELFDGLDFSDADNDAHHSGFGGREGGEGDCDCCTRRGRKSARRELSGESGVDLGRVDAELARLKLSGEGDVGGESGGEADVEEEGEGERGECLGVGGLRERACWGRAGDA
ncbi:hypothetical protein MBLNU230_g3000t1 [Neophaeotheca triangularis]